MRTLIARFRHSLLLTATVALPLVASACGDVLTGTDDSDDFDGTYRVVAVDNRSMPAKIIDVDSRNYLLLTRGEWVVSGSTVRTSMWTTSYINGQPRSEARFNPERHTGTITVSGNTATVVLDTGSRITASLSDNGLTYTSNGRTIRFVKD